MSFHLNKRKDGVMEDFLNRSDELHIEILHLLEGVAPFPGKRHEVAMVACGMALEHALSLRLLVRISSGDDAFAV